MEQTHRAKEMYPICMRQVFKAAQLEINDYDNGIIRIKTNPWVKVQIPKADRTEKLALAATRRGWRLAGINTVDLFNLRKEDYHGHHTLSPLSPRHSAPHQARMNSMCNSLKRWRHGLFQVGGWDKRHFLCAL